MPFSPDYPGGSRVTFGTSMPVYENSKICEIYGSAPSIELLGEPRELTPDEVEAWDSIRNATAYPPVE